MELLFFVIGLVILVKGADFLVDGASSLAAKFKISPIVIGLTIVAFGTSAPELVVSVTSALRGNTDIALGNVLGSNVFNILFILGLSSIIYPLVVAKNTVWKEIPFSLLGVFVIMFLGLGTFVNNWAIPNSVLTSNEIVGTLDKSGGLILLSFFVIFLYYTFGISKTEGSADLNIKKQPMIKSILFIIGGLLGLTVGSQIAIENVIALARQLNISDTLIGFTLVAAGTSFPELFTNIAAVRKKNADIAVGNIIGSNIFNIFLILGVTAFLRDVPIRGIQIVDLTVLLIATSVLFGSIFVWKRHSIGRKEGVFMFAGHIAYTVFLIMRG